MALATSAPLRMPPDTISCTSSRLHRPSLLQRLHGLRDGGQRRDADVLDEHLLGGGGAALHAVDHDDVRTGVHGQFHVVVGAGGADLDVDRLLPVGDLAQFVDLDGQVVGAGPVRVPAGRCAGRCPRAGCACRRRARRSSARAACRRRRAWRPGRARPRSRRPCAGRRGSSRSATEGTGRQGTCSGRAPPVVMPPSPVVVEVPTSLAPRPSASLAWPDSAPKLIPAMVTGMSRCRGCLACRSPSTTSVPHRSR